MGNGACHSEAPVGEHNRSLGGIHLRQLARDITGNTQKQANRNQGLEYHRNVRTAKVMGEILSDTSSVWSPVAWEVPSTMAGTGLHDVREGSKCGAKGNKTMVPLSSAAGTQVRKRGVKKYGSPGAVRC